MPKPQHWITHTDQIEIIGAREHNLKNVSLNIPRDQFVVITGVSGSGKSTLAFDILFSEGQRRFLDSMNAYARQFVEQMPRPDVDRIVGLPPTVSIEQRNSQGGGKSTVGTVTEIHQFLRLLFARLGTPYCPECNLPVQGQTTDAIIRALDTQVEQRGRLSVLAPMIRNRKGFHTEIAEWALKHGYQRLRADGEWHQVAQPFKLDRYKEHDVEVEVGLLKNSDFSAAQHTQSLVETALEIGKGILFAVDDQGEVSMHSTQQACPSCGHSTPPLDPKLFSYHSSRGWCPECRGFGELFYVPEKERESGVDAVEESWFHRQEGKRELCPSCHGSRLNLLARSVRLSLHGYPSSLPKMSGYDFHEQAPNIDAFSNLVVKDALNLFDGIQLEGRERDIARDILPEIRERLFFLKEVGLDYMQLGRSVTTLSGGENQRIRLAAQLGSTLSGVLYVLDEPTIGLHARDNEQLLKALKRLRARGNSLVVVEHDEDTMRAADYIIDLGPKAGVYGGEIVASGTLKQLCRNPASITGNALKERRNYPMHGAPRPVQMPAVKAGKGTRKKSNPKKEVTPSIILSNACLNNLKHLTVQFPVNRFILVTGVSGSGKSSLIRDCLVPLAKEAINKNGVAELDTMKLAGIDVFNAIHEVDQSPIGRTPRSTPGTYVGFFDEIRKLFSTTPEARMRGYLPGRFSFNSKAGRCPECEGMGAIKMEMNFLPPSYTHCELCDGSRFNQQTLDVEYGGKNIAEVLDLSVAEAIVFFHAVPKVRRALEALQDTGLDYLSLGQTSPTLSGGEAQRLKLVTHLLTGLKPGKDSLRSRHNAKLFVLEEPTIGLHHADVRRLVEVLHRLVDGGHTVIVIEHHMELIAEADWVIDMGPEGGENGGEILVQGPPEKIAACKRSHTGRFLKRLFDQ
ncbi:excinuclease ABC subunit A [Verrucomicrobia bacterium]|nr:excinuclease ABC subunit A [Verrucomicrobiota bacterium]